MNSVTPPWNIKLFKDRYIVGGQITKQFLNFTKDVIIILSLTRGGISVKDKLLQELPAPLHIISIKKIGLFHNIEFIIGAIAEKEVKIKDDKLILQLGILNAVFFKKIKKENQEFKRRNIFYKNKPFFDFKHKTVILVDDDLVRGAAFEVSIETVKKFEPKKLIFISPVCDYDKTETLYLFVNNVTPIDFTAIGLWHQNFSQISNEEVLDFLEKSGELFKKYKTSTLRN